MERKKIKGSQRGLTFSFEGKDTFKPGTKFRYVLDVEKKTILIYPSKDGGNQISKKKSGNRIKSLVDLRNREIKELVCQAKAMEIEIAEDDITVYLYETGVTENIICLSERTKKVKSICISREFLKASGGYDDTWNENAAIKSIKEDSKQAFFSEDEEFRNVIRTISLFSGAGMLDYAFCADKYFKVIYAAEYDPEAVKTYQENIGDHVQCVDIRKLSAKDLPDADLIIGGPPCQPFSNANRREEARHENHKEGDMFFHYIRLIKETFVKAFVIENVPGILTDRNGYYVQELTDALPNYEISTKIITDCDLGGYTKRKRAVLIGSRIGKAIFPDLKLRPIRTVKDALLKVDDSWPNAKDITKSSEKVRKKISLIPEGGNWRDLPEALWTKSVHSNMYRRLDRNQPSIAIANWRKYLLSPPKWDASGKWDRILSVSEAAALQGFGKDFAFYGTMNGKQQQVANGVTLATGKFIREIIKKLFQNLQNPQYV